jgi:hypothetical protein
VLRGVVTVDAATAAGGAPLRGGLWDTYARIRLGGWTKESRVGPGPRKARAATSAGVVAGRMVLPYWTDRHGTLSLDVDRAVKRLGLNGLSPDDTDASTGRLRAPLPLYAPARTRVLLKLTSSDASVETPGTLSPADDAAVLDAALPVTRLDGATWRSALCLAPDADEPRFLPLPLALRAAAGTVEVVRPPRPGVVRQLARQVRRLLAVAIGRKASGSAASRT